MPFVILVILAVLTVANPLRAETYQWVDDKGVTNFTDNPDRIPAKYRSKTQTLPSVDAESRPAPRPTVKPSLPAPSPTNVPTLFGGLDETGWRAKFSVLRTELKGLQEGLPAKRDELNTLRRKRVIAMGSAPGKQRQAYYAKLAEIEKDDARIKELETQLTALDQEARKLGVPAEWRQ